MNSAGKSTRKMEADRRKIRHILLFGMLALLVFAGVLVVVSVVLDLRMSARWGVGGFAVFLAVLGGIKFGVERADKIIGPMIQYIRKRERHASQGAQGEEIVGQLLESFAALGDLVWHDVSSPFGNVDHIVLTQTGHVFVIETKSHHGRISVDRNQLLLNGKFPEKDFVVQALKNTYWLKREVDRLTGHDVWIHSVIVFTNAYVPRHCSVKKVAVINKRALDDSLTQRRLQVPKVNVWPCANKIAELLGPPTNTPAAVKTAFYLFLNEEVQGPFTLEMIHGMLRTEAVDPSTLCCLEETQEWQPIGCVVSE